MSTISKNSCNILKRLPRTVRDSNIIQMENGNYIHLQREVIV